MPYSTAYDDTVPAGSDFLSLGDDSIREFKDANKERLESFFTGIDIDPLTPKASSIPTSALKLDGGIMLGHLDPSLQLKSIIISLQSVSTTLAFPHGTYVHDYTVTGAEPGDVVLLSFLEASATFQFHHGWVSATDTVTVTFGNDSDSVALTLDEQFYIVIIKPGTPGLGTGGLAPVLIPHTEFQPDIQTDTLTYSATEVAPNTLSAITLLASATPSVGKKLDTASVDVRADNTATLTGNLYKVNAGVATSLWTIAATVGGGVQTLNTTGLNYTIVDGDIFVFELVLTSTGSTNPNDVAVRVAKLTFVAA